MLIDIRTRKGERRNKFDLIKETIASCNNRKKTTANIWKVWIYNGTVWHKVTSNFDFKRSTFTAYFFVFFFYSTVSFNAVNRLRVCLFYRITRICSTLYNFFVSKCILLSSFGLRFIQKSLLYTLTCSSYVIFCYTYN